MNKDEFLSEEKRLQDIIVESGTALNKLRSDFITNNKPFEIGDKVEVSYPNSDHRRNQIYYGIVTGFEENNGMVTPILCQIKKDGTASTRKLWTSYGAKFEKAETNITPEDQPLRL